MGNYPGVQISDFALIYRGFYGGTEVVCRYDLFSVLDISFLQ